MKEKIEFIDGSYIEKNSAGFIYVGQMANDFGYEVRKYQGEKKELEDLAIPDTAKLVKYIMKEETTTLIKCGKCGILRLPEDKICGCVENIKTVLCNIVHTEFSRFFSKEPSIELLKNIEIVFGNVMDDYEKECRKDERQMIIKELRNFGISCSIHSLVLTPKQFEAQLPKI